MASIIWTEPALDQLNDITELCGNIGAAKRWKIVRQQRLAKLLPLSLQPVPYPENNDGAGMY